MMYFSKENNYENTFTHYIKIVNALRYVEYDNTQNNDFYNTT